MFPQNHEYETSVKQLTLQVDEIKDKNEELEFQVLELEGCRGDVKVVKIIPNNYLKKFKSVQTLFFCLLFCIKKQGSLDRSIGY